MATRKPNDPGARRLPAGRRWTSDPDVPPIPVGDETGDASSPRPDENVVDEIGQEAGMTFQDDEPLRPIEKVGERDRERWEMDPASSADYAERRRDEKEDVDATQIGDRDDGEEWEVEAEGEEDADEDEEFDEDEDLGDDEFEGLEEDEEEGDEVDDGDDEDVEDEE